MRLEEEAKLANIRLLNTSRVEKPTGDASKAQGSSIEHRGSLMFINGEVNNGDVKVLVDTGATHNFLALGAAKDLGVKFTRVHGEMKAMNSPPTPVYGRAWNVPIRLGKWRGKVDFLVTDMDDESVVLGIEFLNKVVPFTMGDGVLTITSKGNKNDIGVEASKEVGTSRISSLRATWTLKGKRQGKVQRRTNLARGLPREGTKYRVFVQRTQASRGYGKAGPSLDEGVKDLGGGECHGPTLNPPGTLSNSHKEGHRGVPWEVHGAIWKLQGTSRRLHRGTI